MYHIYVYICYYRTVFFKLSTGPWGLQDGVNVGSSSRRVQGHLWWVDQVRTGSLHRGCCICVLVLLLVAWRNHIPSYISSKTTEGWSEKCTTWIVREVQQEGLLFEPHHEQSKAHRLQIFKSTKVVDPTPLTHQRVLSTKCQGLQACGKAKGCTKGHSSKEQSSSQTCTKRWWAEAGSRCWASCPACRSSQAETN